MEAKYIVVIVLFVALVVAKFLAGGKPFDRPVRRPRRFGHRGEMGPIANPPPGSAGLRAGGPPPDPEKEFFGDDGKPSS